MYVKRGVSLILSAAIAGPWSLSLSVAGLWLLTAPGDLWPTARLFMMIGGVTLMAAGQLVFLVFIADRFFPLAGKRLGPWLEMPISIVVILGSIGLVALLILRLWMGPTP